MPQFSFNRCILSQFDARMLALRGKAAHPAAMFNILSVLIGLFALILMIPTVIPLLGWANWFILPVAVVGLLFGLLSSRTSGRNLCLIVIALGSLRLFLGGGII
jgi:predicted membrane protein